MQRMSQAHGSHAAQRLLEYANRRILHCNNNKKLDWNRQGIVGLF
jgi:hypothetical protein